MVKIGVCTNCGIKKEIVPDEFICRKCLIEKQTKNLDDLISELGLSNEMEKDLKSLTKDFHLAQF